MTDVCENPESSTAPAIALRDLRFGWSVNTPPLLAVTQLDIARGERLFLYGPSGSGKTTLLNLLAGVTVAQQGTLNVLGRDFTTMSQRQRDKFRARHIGVVFQQFNLIPYLSVLDNAVLGAHFAGLPPGEGRHRAGAILNSLGLSASLFEQAAHRLSVGQQQRVAVARALTTAPEILIADEPTSALDSDNRDAFMQMLFESTDSAGCTVIFVSHDKSLQPYFSRAVDMREFLYKPAAAATEATC